MAPLLPCLWRDDDVFNGQRGVAATAPQGFVELIQSMLRHRGIARTLARVLKSQGYQTALVGKWHLGLRPEVGPLEYGFDQSYGYLHGQVDPLIHDYKNGDRTWHPSNYTGLR